MLSQEAVELIRESFSEALAQYNAIAKDKLADNDKNFDIAAAVLQADGLPQDKWFNKNVWFAVLGKVNADMDKVAVKSRAELIAERNASDRKNGSRSENASAKKAGTGSTGNALLDAFKELDKTINSLGQNAAPTAKAQFPTYDVDFEDMDDANKKLFLALSTENMKAWIKKRNVVKHRQQYGLDPQ